MLKFVSDSFFSFSPKQCMPIKTQELSYQNKPMAHSV